MEENISNEPQVVFNAMSDKRVFGVKSEETDEVILEISGYDLDIRFNRDKMRNIEDIEGVLDGLKDLFRQLILDDLLKDNNRSSND